jgi:hypothetical protein
MDTIPALAATTVATLAPYLTEAGKEFAKTIGKSAVDKIGVLYQALTNHFRNNNSGQKALADLRSQPEKADVRSILQDELTEQMNSDPTFKNILRKLLDAIDQDDEAMAFLRQIYGSQVKSVSQIVGSGMIAVTGSISAGNVTVDGGMNGNIVIGNQNVVHSTSSRPKSSKGSEKE